MEYLAKHFWNFVVAEKRMFTKVMEADEELAKRVFSLLAGHPEAGVKNEADGKMKVEEPFGEGKDQSATPATDVGDEAEDSLIREGNSQELLTLDYNGPISHHKDEFPLTGLTRAAKVSVDFARAADHISLPTSRTLQAKQPMVKKGRNECQKPLNRRQPSHPATNGGIFEVANFLRLTLIQHDVEVVTIVHDANGQLRSMIDDLETWSNASALAQDILRDISRLPGYDRRAREDP